MSKTSSSPYSQKMTAGASPEKDVGGFHGSFALNLVLFSYSIGLLNS